MVTGSLNMVIFLLLLFIIYYIFTWFYFCTKYVKFTTFTVSNTARTQTECFIIQEVPNMTFELTKSPDLTGLKHIMHLSDLLENLFIKINLDIKPSKFSNNT